MAARGGEEGEGRQREARVAVTDGRDDNKSQHPCSLSSSCAWTISQRLASSNALGKFTASAHTDIPTHSRGSSVLSLVPACSSPPRVLSCRRRSCVALVFWSSSCVQRLGAACSSMRACATTSARRRSPVGHRTMERSERRRPNTSERSAHARTERSVRVAGQRIGSPVTMSLRFGTFSGDAGTRPHTVHATPRLDSPAASVALPLSVSSPCPPRSCVACLPSFGRALSAAAARIDSALVGQQQQPRKRRSTSPHRHHGRTQGGHRIE